MFIPWHCGRQFEGQACKFRSHGGVYNKNTIEDFKKCDKVALLNEEGADIWQDITTGLCLEQPSRLSRFTLITFGVSDMWSRKQVPYADWWSPYHACFPGYEKIQLLLLVCVSMPQWAGNRSSGQCQSHQRRFHFTATWSFDSTIFQSQVVGGTAIFYCREERDGIDAHIGWENHCRREGDQFRQHCSGQFIFLLCGSMCNASRCRMDREIVLLDDYSLVVSLLGHYQTK